MAFAMPHGSSSRCRSASTSRAAHRLRESIDRRNSYAGSHCTDWQDPVSTHSLRFSRVPTPCAREVGNAESTSAAPSRTRLRDKQAISTPARRRPSSAPGGASLKRTFLRPISAARHRDDAPSALIRSEFVTESHIPSPVLDGVGQDSACRRTEAGLQADKLSQCSSAAPAVKTYWMAPYHTSIVSSIHSGGLQALISDPAFRDSKRDPRLIQRDLRYGTHNTPGVCVERLARFPDVIGDKPSPAEVAYGHGIACCKAALCELQARQTRGYS
jgi:hypothetical protein